MLTIRRDRMLHMGVTMSQPAADVTLDTLQFVADLLGVKFCWYYGGRFHFTLGDPDVTLAITPESAGRYCVEICRYAVPGDKKWVTATNRARLAQLVLDATEVMMDGAHPCAHDPV